MIHDSLCPTWNGSIVCECDTIAKVRADCLEKVEGAYIVGSDGEALTPSHPEYSHDGTETWNSAIDLAVAYMTGKID
jgi:hypothetical protein